MIRGVVLEGISCSGKTSVLNALKSVHLNNPESERSVIVLGEHYTQVLQNYNGTLHKYSREEHLSLLDQRLSALENLHYFSDSLGPYSQRARGLFFILERFHLNHKHAYPNASQNEILKIEQRLKALNAQCFVLSISASVVRNRMIHRHKEFNSASKSCINTTINEHIAAGNKLIQIAKKSFLGYREINTDAMNWEIYAELILDQLDHSD